MALPKRSLLDINPVFTGSTGVKPVHFWKHWKHNEENFTRIHMFFQRMKRAVQDKDFNVGMKPDFKVSAGIWRR